MDENSNTILRSFPEIVAKTLIYFQNNVQYIKNCECVTNKIGSFGSSEIIPKLNHATFHNIEWYVSYDMRVSSVGLKSKVNVFITLMQQLAVRRNKNAVQFQPY